jgi:hypothetical protein
MDMQKLIHYFQQREFEERRRAAAEARHERIQNERDAALWTLCCDEVQTAGYDLDSAAGRVMAMF